MRFHSNKGSILKWRLYGWEKMRIKLGFLQILPCVFLIYVFFPSSSYSISCLPSWETLDGFPGFTLGGLGPAPLNAHPKQLLLGQPFADVLTPPSLLSFLVPSIYAFLCYFFNLRLFCLFSYIFCFILNILKVLRRWIPRLFCVP